MAKGRRVAVIGRLEYREWTNDEGRHSLHEVAAAQIEFLQAPKDTSGTEADGGDDYPAEPFQRKGFPGRGGHIPHCPPWPA